MQFSNFPRRLALYFLNGSAAIDFVLPACLSKIFERVYGLDRAVYLPVVQILCHKLVAAGMLSRRDNQRIIELDAVVFPV